MIKEIQYRTLIKEFNKSGEIKMSSMKSGMDRKTGKKYLELGKGPNEVKQPHTWRTRKDPFADVADEINDMLENAEELAPITIFDYLQELLSCEKLLTMDAVKHKLELPVSIPKVNRPAPVLSKYNEFLTLKQGGLHVC